MAAAFDTLQAARDLEAAGLDPKHAEAIVGAVHNAQGDLVTTPVLKAELAELQSRLSALETRLILRILAIVGAAVAILAAIEQFSG
ncbi:MAG: hypothetical protein OXE57_10510 [Alphaproteobacteria bacterium]|nr:hypothetical protein [Alphaproteobacteria bacterium]